MLSPRTSQKLAWAGAWLAASAVLLILASVLGFIFFRGISSISWGFLTRPITEDGIYPAIVGTLYVVVLTLLVSVPLGLGAAIYLAEYAPTGRFSALLRYGTEMLAGVPSIVIGLFGMALFVIVLIGTQCVLAGSLTMACLVLPTMIRASEEAIRTVPVPHKEASLALGATKWQTITRVVLPVALPGIVTAVILCIGRAIEETACLYATLGLSMLTPFSVLDGGRTLSLHLYLLATEMPGNRHQLISQAMGTALMLVVIVIATNLSARHLSHRYASRAAGTNRPPATPYRLLPRKPHAPHGPNS